MSVFFRVEFKCDNCGAEILYEDEIPVIKKDLKAIISNNKATKWQKQYDTADKATRNKLVRSMPSQLTEPTRYLLCTVCNGRIYL